MKEKKEMMNRSEVINLLHEQVADIVFTKVDGTERKMRCTLKSDELPAVESQEGESKAPRKSNPDVFAVFDLDNRGWRSFRWDNLQTVNGETVGTQ